MFRKLLLIFGMLLLPIAVLAQEDLSETYVSERGNIVVRHPASWTAEDKFGMVILTYNEVESIFVRYQDAFEPDMNLDLVQIALTAAEESFSFPNYYEIGEPVSLTISGYKAVQIPVTTSNMEKHLFLVLEKDKRLYYLGYTNLGNEEYPHQETFHAIGAALQYPAENIRIAPGIPWQLTQPLHEPENGWDVITDLAAGNDMIYVALRSEQVVMLDTAGQILKVLPIRVNDQATMLHSIAVTPEGNFWLVDHLFKQIHLVNTEGTILLSLGASQEPFFGNWSTLYIQLQTDDKGNLYVLISEPRGTDRVGIFDQAGALQQTFILSEDFKYQYFDVSGEGYLYLPVEQVYRQTDQVDVFSATDGSFVRSISLEEEIQDYGKILVLPDGSFYLVGAYKSKIYHFGSDGELLWEFGRQVQDYEEEIEPGKFASGPFALAGLVVLPNGDLIIGDNTLDYAQVIRLEPTTLQALENE